jgi:hypothetical protein
MKGCFPGAAAAGARTNKKKAMSSTVERYKGLVWHSQCMLEKWQVSQVALYV